MTDIRELDPQTVERIAAGEVVERPASVVKELVENSLDAGADRVEVAVDSGGKAGIRVSDDGAGMTREEVRRAVEKHTTSKIRDVADLEGGVATLGFRGEALHAIGAVSRMTVTTRPRADRDVESDRGTELTVEGGEVTSVEPAGCPPGTTVEVRDLFYNVPARRKYLKQDSTEFAHVNRVVTSYALANPDVAVSLAHGDRETFATTGGGDRREAVMSVYGREVADSMIAVDARQGAGERGSETDGGDAAALPGGPLDAVSGLVSHPETTRASREYLSTYVNGRYVTAGAVRDAVVAAYDAQLASDRYPFAVLFLDLPAGDVDVNVHPRKLEVRFADETGVREQVRTAVRDALLREGLLRSSAPRGVSAPEQTEVTPADDQQTNTDDDTPDRPGTDAGDRSGGDRSNGPGDCRTARTGSDRTGRADAGAAGDASGRPGGGTGDSPAAGAPESTSPTGSTGGDAGSTEGSDGSTGGDAGPTEGSDGSTGGDAGSTSGDGHGRSRRDPHDRDAARKFAGDHSQARLGGDRDGTAGVDGDTFDSLPAMEVMGQFDDTYVVAATDDGLVLIDQHAADERVNYERLRERFAGEVTTQALAEPVAVSLTAREAELFEAHSEALATLGFRAARADERTVEVRTVPSLVADAADPALLRDVLGAFVADGDPAETVEAAADELLADLACYPSVTGNTSLSEGSIRELLAALDDCENPWACPHGRPVIVEFDADEIEARFERDYPGHGTRRT